MFVHIQSEIRVLRIISDEKVVASVNDPLARCCSHIANVGALASVAVLIGNLLSYIVLGIIIIIVVLIIIVVIIVKLTKLLVMIIKY